MLEWWTTKNAKELEWVETFTSVGFKVYIWEHLFSHLILHFVSSSNDLCSVAILVLFKIVHVFGPNALQTKGDCSVAKFIATL